MCQNWSPCTPTTLDLDQGLPGNVVRVVNFGARVSAIFSNGRHENLNWAIILLLIDIES